MKYQKIELAGPTAIGVPAPLPAELVGLAQETLNDLSSLSGSVPELDGVGYWPVTEVKPTPASGYKLASTTTLDVDADSKSVTATFDTERKPIAQRRDDLAADVKARVGELIAAGFDYEVPGTGETHTYQINAAAQDNMVAIEADFLGVAVDAHGGYWRSKDNVNVEMTDSQVRAFFQAAKNHKMAIIRRAQALGDAIGAAADHDALDLINIATGAIDGEGGWPS